MKRICIIVDMLEGFYRIGALANPRVANILPNIWKFINEEDISEYILLCDSHGTNDNEFRMFPPHSIAGSEEAKVIYELENMLRDTDSSFFNISKSTFDGFYDTDLAEILEILKPDEIIVMGVCTDICILFAVAGCKFRGYKTIVYSKCVETYNTEDHNADAWNTVALGYMKNVLGAEIRE